MYKLIHIDECAHGYTSSFLQNVKDEAQDNFGFGLRWKEQHPYWFAFHKNDNNHKKVRACIQIMGEK
jgi:hypothetical protein